MKRLILLIVVMLVAGCKTIEQSEDVTSGDYIDFATTNYCDIVGSTNFLTRIIIDPGVFTTTTIVIGDDVLIINCKDGSVTLGKNITTNEACRAFWKAMEDSYPYMFPAERRTNTARQGGKAEG